VIKILLFVSFLGISNGHAALYGNKIIRLDKVEKQTQLTGHVEKIEYLKDEVLGVKTKITVGGSDIFLPGGKLKGSTYKAGNVPTFKLNDFIKISVKVIEGEHWYLTHEQLKARTLSSEENIKKVITEKSKAVRKNKVKNNNSEFLEDKRSINYLLGLIFLGITIMIIYLQRRKK